MKTKKIPLIKEYRVDKLKACLECIDSHPFNRDRQKECILSLYPGKSEKSVFRGMIIPSLRHLGLIIGYRGFIRLSANGKIIIESKSLGDELHRRVLKAVVYEIDENKFGFMDIIVKKAPFSKQDFLSFMSSIVNAPNEKQKRERISHWLSVLKQVKLVDCNDQKHLNINGLQYKQTLSDMNTSFKNPAEFKRYLFDAYFELYKVTAGVVDIADLREKVALKTLRNDKKILTEKQFDGMLRRMPFTTDDYLISFGRPMGAEEKLFEYKGNYFRTLSIRIFKGEVTK